MTNLALVDFEKLPSGECSICAFRSAPFVLYLSFSASPCHPLSFSASPCQPLHAHIDHVAAWKLEERSGGLHDEESSIMDVVLRSKNLTFASNSRVVRITQFWLSNSWVSGLRLFVCSTNLAYLFSFFSFFIFSFHILPPISRRLIILSCFFSTRLTRTTCQRASHSIPTTTREATFHLFCGSACWNDLTSPSPSPKSSTVSRHFPFSSLLPGECCSSTSS